MRPLHAAYGAKRVGFDPLFAPPCRYYWLTGRVDDVINVSGHRIGTAEVESSLDEHADCAEAAVVGYPHPIKGEGIYAYVTLNTGVEPTEELRKQLMNQVRVRVLVPHLPVCEWNWPAMCAIPQICAAHVCLG